jgi:two-component system, OmpR family, sensor kinase
VQQLKGIFKSFFVPGSLKSQLLSRTLIILSILLALIGVSQYVLMREVIYQNRAASLQSQVMSIPHDVWGGGLGDYLDNDAEDRKRDSDHPHFYIPQVNLAFMDLKGNFSVLQRGPDGSNSIKLDTSEYLNLLNTKPGLHYKVVNAGGVEQLVVLQPIGHPDHPFGVAEICTPTSPLRELLLRQLLTFLGLSFLAMLIGLFGFMPILKKTLVPLFNMVETAEQIDGGNLMKRFPIKQGQMEIDRLAESFNGMMERLEASFEAERETKEQMRRFIADASHELRTPLTSIHGFLEVLLRGAANNPEQMQKALISMLSESERVNKLVADLLLLAKLDRTPFMELKEGFLDQVILEMEPQLRILAGKRMFRIESEANLRCKFDADKMKQVILNLFHNAVQHTDPDIGEIKILLNRKNNGIQFSVQDNGSGISKEHVPHVFDRFYRSDSSRTRKYGGAGLGLSISKSIVEAHGGIIGVNSRKGEGSTFYVWIQEETL